MTLHWDEHGYWEAWYGAYYLGMLGINLVQVALYDLSVEMINETAWYHVRLTEKTMKAYGIDPS